MLVPAQAFVGQFLPTFRDYPQRQKAASFNMDEVFRSWGRVPDRSKRNAAGHLGEVPRNSRD